MKLFTQLSFVLIAFGISASVFGAAGDFDPSFGSGGKVFATVPGMNPAQGMALQPDGKIVIVGSTVGADSTQDFAVIRLNADGSTDTSFGTNGLVAIPFDNFANEFATAVAVQADGKIVVGGSVEFGAQGWDFGIVRLDASGAIDTTYSGGRVKVNIGGDDFVYDLILQTDGKALLTGTIRPTPNTDIPLVRLTTAGVLDTSLNGTGKVFIGIGSGNNDVGASLALQSDGKILVGGSTRDTTSGNFLIVRFNTNGIPDNTFGAFGFIQTSIGTQYDAANSIAIQADGKIVSAGTTTSGASGQPALTRHNSNGSLDTTFDGDGKVVLNPTPGNPTLTASVLIQSDGKIVVVGSGSGSYLLMRLSSNGSLDATFGTGGRALRNVAPAFSNATRGVLQPDGKLVAIGGGTDNVTNGFTAARFLMTGSSARPQFDFDGDAKTDLSIFRPGTGPGQWWYQRSSDGGNRAFSFGAISDTITPADFTGDGKTDIAFFRPMPIPSGPPSWFVLRSEDNTFYSFPFGSDGDVPAPADFDGDNKADATVYRPSTQTWFIARSTGGTDILTFGSSGDVPVAADYDGDGKADIAIYRPNAAGGAQWWIRRSSDGSVFALVFGTSSDRTVAGDYTGDGKADVAFWRPSNGNWFVLRSEDFSFFSFPFGANGDTPVPGDYDGDGKNDAAVFRPSTSTWFANRSTGGTLIQTFGASGDIPVPSAYVR